MTDSGIKKCLRLIMVSFPNHYKNFEEKDFLLLMDAWRVQFNGREDIEVFTALNKVIASSSYPPTFSDINNAIYEDFMKQFPNDEQAWDMVRKNAKWGFYDPEDRKGYDSLPPYIKELISVRFLEDLGWANHETAHFMKKDFLENYHAKLESLKKENQFLSITNGIKKLALKIDSPMIPTKDDDRK